MLRTLFVLTLTVAAVLTAGHGNWIGSVIAVVLVAGLVLEGRQLSKSDL